MPPATLLNFPLLNIFPTCNSDLGLSKQDLVYMSCDKLADCGLTTVLIFELCPCVQVVRVTVYFKTGSNQVQAKLESVGLLVHLCTKELSSLSLIPVNEYPPYYLCMHACVCVCVHVNICLGWSRPSSALLLLTLDFKYGIGRLIDLSG